MRSAAILAAAVALATPAMAGYQLKEDFFDQQGFFSHFDFWTSSDPTHGLVDFVGQSEAKGAGLINSTSSSAWMGADSTTVLSGNNGRKATRITSKKSYTHMLAVIRLERLPLACGAWPAFWTVGPNWPAAGEIDIIEGVNTKGANRMTLHTSDGCKASGQAGGLLKPSVSDCEGHQGCGFTESSDNSWANVNNVGGGVWAMEWTSDGISMWWWGGSNPVPPNVLTDSPTPNTWGKPSMTVPSGDNCNIDSHFRDHQLVFDWTFCGDWAGSQQVWESSGCHSQQYPTCQSYVQNNPHAFAGQGFEVNHLRVYQNDA